MISGIQTHGQLINWHPHLHCPATYGAFTPQGDFLPLPDDLATEPFVEVCKTKVVDLLLSEGRIKVVADMRSSRQAGSPRHATAANQRVVLQPPTKARRAAQRAATKRTEAATRWASVRAVRTEFADCSVPDASPVDDAHTP